MYHNLPLAFWKNLIFQSYKDEASRPWYVMTNANRKIMAQRLASLVVPHDMKAPKNSVFQSLKADEWIDWIVTYSLYSTEGLVDEDLFEIWAKIREGIIIHMNPAKMTLTFVFKLRSIFFLLEKKMRSFFLSKLLHYHFIRY